MKLNKKSISNLQLNTINGAKDDDKTFTAVALACTPVWTVTIGVSYLICPPNDDTISPPDTNRVCDESIKICV